MRAFWWLVALTACSGVFAEPSPDHDRFRGVKKWTGTYSITLSGAGKWTETDTTDCTTTVKTSDSTISRTTSAQVTLDEPDISDAQIRWSGKARITSSTNFTYHWKTVFTDRCAHTSNTSSETGTIKSLPGMDGNLDDGGNLVIDFERGRYDITMRPAVEPVRVESSNGTRMDMTLPAGGALGLNLGIPADFTALNAWIAGADEEELKQLQQRMLSGNAPIPGLDLPTKGMALQSSKTTRIELAPINGLSKAPKQFGTSTFSFQFGPEGQEDLRLVIEPEGYDGWMPRGTIDQDRAGNTIKITARLVDQNGNPPTQSATTIKFAIESSKIPGTAMNFPVAPPAPKPDLRFEQSNNPSPAMITDPAEGSKIEVGESIQSASVVLSSFDWGGWGQLTATAVMPSGKEIIGRLEGSSEPGARIPKRARTSHIAELYVSSNGGRGDEQDDENVPAGDGHLGDGFSFYEEYRGFYVNGEHINGNAARKDFFIRDMIGGISKAGILLMRDLSQLEVHHELTALEIGPGRVMNFNDDGWAHLVDQHGVVLVTGDESHAVGGPGVPESISIVKISTSRDPFDAESLSSYESTIAHELFHCTNVMHHGEFNENVVWVAGPYDAATQEQRVTENGAPVILKKESGARFILEPNSTQPAVVGLAHGQHSGDDQCVMRYDAANAYPSRSDPKVRYCVTEVAGRSLCNSDQGTGVNDPSHTPQSRYFEATKGNCRKQICVSDRYH